MEFIPSLLYFGYTTLMVLSFWLLTGTIGFYAAYVFIRKIYAAVKIDWNNYLSFCYLFFLLFCEASTDMWIASVRRNSAPPMDWRNEQMCFVHRYQNLSVLLSPTQQRCKETWTVPFLMSVYVFAHTKWAKVCRLTFFFILGKFDFWAGSHAFWRHWGLVSYIILQINFVLLI